MNGLQHAFAAARGLSVGTRISDNDPRMPNRILKIARFEATESIVFAICEPVYTNYRPRQFRIAIKRIHSDGKPRKSGFSKVV